jgi:hypothetical protein
VNRGGTVLTMMALSFMVVLLAGGRGQPLLQQVAHPKSKQALTATPGQLGMEPGQALALGAVAVTLAIAADFDEVGPLAQALAGLILVSVLFAYGPQAMTNTQAVVNKEGVKK